MAFAEWMAGWPGRLARIIVGLILIGLGLGVVEGTWGAVLAIVGVVPIAAGVFNVCLIAPLLRAPFRGVDALRARRGCPPGAPIAFLEEHWKGSASYAEHRPDSH